MGGLKRKGAPSSRIDQVDGYNKKIKAAKQNVGENKSLPLGNGQENSRTAFKPVKKLKVPLSDLETATDSDPIIESDTTEHSGEDDGESWPSTDDNNDDGGVVLNQTKPDQLSKVAEPKGHIVELNSCELVMSFIG